MIGVTLWITLVYTAYYETPVPVFAVAGFLVFEGLTNLRLTLITQRLRFGEIDSLENNACSGRILNRIDSERALRLIVALFLSVPFLVIPDFLWFLPWFTAGMLIMAGITNICPMAMFLKWSGMK